MQKQNTKGWLCIFENSFIIDKTDRQIQQILKKEKINMRLAHRNTTLWLMFGKSNADNNNCNSSNCPLQNALLQTKDCNLREHLHKMSLKLHWEHTKTSAHTCSRTSNGQQTCRGNDPSCKTERGYSRIRTKTFYLLHDFISVWLLSMSMSLIHNA